MSEQKKVLVVDDDYHIQISISDLLSYHEIEAKTFGEPTKALSSLRKNQEYHAVITDYKMQNMSGLDILKEVKKIDPELPVIIISAYGNISVVISALREGAYDFIQKPFENEYLLASVKRAIDRYNLVVQNKTLTLNISQKEKDIEFLRRELNKAKKSEYMFLDIVGKSDEMKTIFQLVKDIESTTANVLIMGETGTGKELVAKAIHKTSIRRGKRFVPVNCGAFPENLIESELFGYEKGAFTGAVKKRIGKFEYADGGTLFLDEIGELSLDLQVKLLRVLEEGVVNPLGSNDRIKVDVRIITATNRNLKEMVKENRFREDLFYRLNVIPINVPPLRKRKSDIILLTMHFIKTFNSIYGKNIKSITERLYKYLMTHEWNGNVRELENSIERGIVLTKLDVLDLEHVRDIEESLDNESRINMNGNNNLKKNSETFEKNFIYEVLKKHNGNIQNTATDLDVGLKTLYRKMKKYSISKEILS